MEPWERVVDEWSGEVDIGSFTQLTQIAETVLKEDLARFEIEWISSSLLSEPVHLLQQISFRAGDSAWTKPLTDAFKLITTLVERYPECSDQYHDEIVKACQAPLEARVRGAALQCLSARAARSLRGLCVSAYIAELEAPATCKAPLAALLGTICEFHPEAVAEEIGRVWRAYLNLLDVSKNTESVRNAALRGAGRALTCFGTELPVAEVALLYPALTTDMGDVSLQLLEQHAELFRERLAADAALRRRLWAAAAEGGALRARAARAVTAAALHAADAPHAQRILESEVMPLTRHRVPRVRFAALRVCGAARAQLGASCPVPDPARSVDVHDLEFQLRTDIDDVPEHVAEAVAWCVEARVPHSGVLLQTAILYHERLPAARVRDIVLAGLWAEAAQDVLDPSDSGLEFLVSESSRAGGAERYLPLWRAACAGPGGAPLACKLVRRLAADLRELARAPRHQLPPSVESLVRVCAGALPGAAAEGGGAARALAEPLCAALRAAPALPAAVALLLPALPDTEHARELYQKVDILRAPDEESVCAGALAALHAPPGSMPSGTVLAAIQLVLRRRDAEPASLRRALVRLRLLADAAPHPAPAPLAHVLQLAERLRAHVPRGREGRVARELHRDLDLFLGAQGAGAGAGGGDAECAEVESLVAALGDRVALPLPAADCQLSLQRVVKLALEREEPDSLVVLTALLCDHPSMKSEEPEGGVLAALAHVLAARAACAARGETPPPRAPHLPALAHHLLQRMCSDVSAGTRRVLRDVLRPLLCGAALRHAAEHVTEMLTPGNTLCRRLGAAEGSVPVVEALREDSVAARDLLPALLVRLAGAGERAASLPLTLAAGAWLDMRAVFSPHAVDSAVNELLKVVVELDVSSHAQAAVYKHTVHTTVEFLHKLHEGDAGRVAERCFEVCKREGSSAQCLYVAVVLKRELRLDARRVAREPWLVRALLDQNRTGDFHVETALAFVAEFADQLFEKQYEDTMRALCDILSSLRPRSVPVLRAALEACAGVVGTLPRTLARALETWTETLPLQHIAEHIQNFRFVPSEAAAVRALRCALEVWRPPHAALLLTSAAAAAARWPALVLHLYAQAPTELQEHESYLVDVVWVGLRLGRAGALGRLLQQDAALTRGTFSVQLMPAIYTFLLREPFVLCSPQLAECCSLLRDVAACCVRDTTHAPTLLDLADQLWDRYAAAEDVPSCRVLLSSLVRLGAGDAARAVQWAAHAVGDTARPLADRAALLSVLPPGDHAIAAYASFGRSLPARLSECVYDHARALRSVLDAACARAAPPALLDLVARLAAGDESRGWWDSALESCMASLALHGSGEALHAMHARVLHNPLSSAAFDRLLVPLISYSDADVCEQFFSAVLPSLLGSLRTAPAPAPTRAYARALRDHTLNVTLLKLMVEKVGRGSLESPSSTLHRALAGAAGGAGAVLRPWHAVREACRLIVTLQQRTAPPAGAGAAPELDQAIRVFQQRAYNALCALVCVWRADARLYRAVLGPAWDKLLGTEPYSLPLRSAPFQARRRLVAASGEAGAGPAEGGTSRPPRVFLRTLSECPFSFDLFQQTDEPAERIELVVSDSSLNRHPCAGALSALLRHLAGPGAAPAPAPVPGEGPAWHAALCHALRTAPTNVRWLLAQCVVNVREEVGAHGAAGDVSAALLAAVCDTAASGLNSLHVDVLETVARWHSPPPAPVAPPAALVSACASLLVRACVERGAHHALLATLGTFLRAFPDTRLEWADFQPHLHDSGGSAACVRVLSRAVRAGVRVPELVPALLERLARSDRREISETCALFGAAARALPAEEQACAWQQFGALAVRARSGSVTQYVSMLHHARCTDVKHFKSVADTAMKVRTERGKCVSVLAASMLASTPESRVRLRALLPAELRTEVADKCPALAFEESFDSATESPPAKRARVQCVRKRVLGSRADERTFAHALAALDAHERWDRLHEKLTEDNLALRFVECFYACVYLPAKYPPASPGSGQGEGAWGARLAALVRLFLRHLRAQPRHQRATIPAPVLAQGAEQSACGTRVGTLRTPALTGRTRTLLQTGGARHTAPAPAPALAAGEELPLPVEQALDTLLRFGESCWEVGAWIAVQAWVACAGAGASSHAGMLADMLADTLYAAPCMLRLATDLAPVLPHLDLTGLEEAVERGAPQWAGTEAEGEVRMLQDEVRVRAPPHPALRTLGVASDAAADVTPDSRDANFTIQALLDACGSLSDWSHRSVAARRRVEACLPPLWTSREHFRELLQRYNPEGEGWFARCVRVRRGGCDVTRHLRCAGVWPRNHFHVAAVVEAIEENRGGRRAAPQPDDPSCLAEWAARLQLRAAGGSSSRSHALAWARAALARDLPALALHCVRANTEDGGLPEREALGWAVVRARGLRDTGREGAALRVAESGRQLVGSSCTRDVLELCVLELQLGGELAALTDDIVETALSTAAACERDDASATERDTMQELCELAMLHYDDSWGTRDPDDSIMRMCDVLEQCASETNVALLLNRLHLHTGEKEKGDGLGEAAADRLLDTVLPAVVSLPEQFGARLVRCLPALPASARDKHAPFIHKLMDRGLDEWRSCLQLLCGAEQTLLAHCSALDRALQAADESAWRRVFPRLRDEVWENARAGADYRALHAHRQAFHDLERLEFSDEAACRAALRAAAGALRVAAPRARRSVAALCPALVGPARDVTAALAAILHLPEGDVLGLEDQIPVFTDAVSAPGVLCVRLTGARRRRYLLKRERLALDAAAAQAHRALAPDHPPPEVILLSEECGLIHFLEGYERLRDLIRGECDLTGVPMERQARRAEELVLAPAAHALRNFAHICDHVPPDALRRAFRRRTADPAHLLRASRAYVRSLARGALVDWLLGLGDRHAHNVLLAPALGAVCSVDAGALFQRGVRELPPARLTAQLQAPAHHGWLEPELQRALLELRGRRRRVLPRIALAFAHAGDYSREVSIIEELLSGRALASDVTARALQHADLAHAHRYLELLQELFAHVHKKHTYSVQEQVSSLLLLSTAPRVLSVTRSEWEPWL